ncbi:alpha/beta hydrolase family protein [Streptomyces scopuliridis]|uniref:Alpha/beta hydrolase family protein n=1 Tax=Streptomyces scopuliridis TaxID=452529 RepID=A0ACD4ZR91_9ACTN|nr:alpha/beta hydrolase [Streptomyces scopuliridis]WSB36025.1 alpha/beta hydrolase family protein [Streptomyces scopuliridis]WSC00327.1 alpha/beta hydrolase family protein [Streptomyces scopuliridis]WSC06062.1 alpha/beta hydrolase family protein [Streptomyces scopuliridis]
MRRYRRTLVAAALATTMVGGTAGWASGSSQRAVTGPPVGSAAWRADDSLGRALPDPATATPGQVAQFFATLTPGQSERLVRRHPLVVGNLDGAPVPLRYEANSRAVRAEHDPRYERLAEPGRQILAFDPRGRGQVAEVYGDLATARHVSVVVPGSDIDAATFDRTNDPYGTPAGMAGSLRAATGGRTAVIAWAGYTTPVGFGLDVASGDLAEAGAGRLARFTQGLTAAGVGEPALFCHSYGAVVCGLAASEVNATDIVVLGAPGMRAGHVADLHTDARVWAAKDPSDWISKVPHVEFAGLGHGQDPTAPSFGARRVPADRAEGHTGYFAPGTDSLRAFAAIAQGRVTQGHITQDQVTRGEVR